MPAIDTFSETDLGRQTIRNSRLKFSQTQLKYESLREGSEIHMRVFHPDGEARVGKVFPLF